jgi:hypothetical protein
MPQDATIAAARLTPRYLFMAIPPKVGARCRYDTFSQKTATLKENRPAQRACSTMCGAGFAISSNWGHQRQ